MSFKRLKRKIHTLFGGVKIVKTSVLTKCKTLLFLTKNGKVENTSLLLHKKNKNKILILTRRFNLTEENFLYLRGHKEDIFILGKDRVNRRFYSVSSKIKVLHPLSFDKREYHYSEENRFFFLLGNALYFFYSGKDKLVFHFFKSTMSLNLENISLILSRDILGIYYHNTLTKQCESRFLENHSSSHSREDEVSLLSSKRASEENTHFTPIPNGFLKFSDSTENSKFLVSENLQNFRKILISLTPKIIGIASLDFKKEVKAWGIGFPWSNSPEILHEFDEVILLKLKSDDDATQSSYTFFDISHLNKIIYEWIGGEFNIENFSFNGGCPHFTEVSSVIAKEFPNNCVAPLILPYLMRQEEKLILNSIEILLTNEYNENSLVIKLLLFVIREESLKRYRKLMLLRK